jgi:hypothetical protein
MGKSKKQKRSKLVDCLMVRVWVVVDLERKGRRDVVSS